MNVKGNGVFWGKPQDAIANNLFKNNANKKSPMPGMLAGVQQNPDVKPKKSNSLWDGVKNLASSAWKHKDMIWSAAQTLAPVLLRSPVPAEDETKYAVKTNYMASLTATYEDLYKLKAQNPGFEHIDNLLEQVAQARDKARSYPGRLIPLTAPPSDETELSDTDLSIEEKQISKRRAK